MVRAPTQSSAPYAVLRIALERRERRRLHDPILLGEQIAPFAGKAAVFGPSRVGFHPSALLLTLGLALITPDMNDLIQWAYGRRQLS